MDDFTRFNITGFDRASKRMQRLSRGMRLRGFRSASRKAMNIVRDAARANARAFDDPETKEAIWKRIVTQESRRRSTGFDGIIMRVGVRGGARSSKSRTPPWYWRLKEFGAEHMEAEPFMRPALAENIDQVTNTMVSESIKEIDKLLAGS